MRAASILKSGLAIVPIMLFACGGDGGTSPGRDSESSSSSVPGSSGSSSSSGAVSSSSVVVDPSDSTRAATFADLPPVFDMGSEMGLTLRYVVSANGVCSKVFVDTQGATLAQVSGSCTLSSTGELAFDSTRTSGYSTLTNPTYAQLYADLMAKPSRLLRVHKTSGVIYGGVARDDWKAINAATLVASSGVLVTKASELTGLYNYRNTNGDSVLTVRLYADGTYQREAHLKDTLWEVGRYDVQNQYLLLVPDAFDANLSVDPLDKVSFIRANSSGQWSSLSASKRVINYTRGTLAPTLDVTVLAGNWTVNDGTKLWSLALSSGNATLKVESNNVSDGMLFQDVGYYKAYGDYLMLDFYTGNSSCQVGSGAGQAAFPSCYIYLLGTASVTSGVLTYGQTSLPATWNKAN